MRRQGRASSSSCARTASLTSGQLRRASRSSSSSSSSSSEKKPNNNNNSNRVIVLLLATTTLGRLCGGAPSFQTNDGETTTTTRSRRRRTSILHSRTSSTDDEEREPHLKKARDDHVLSSSKRTKGDSYNSHRNWVPPANAKNASIRGKFRVSRTSFVALKFHRTASLYVKAALVHAVGLNRTFSEFRSLDSFRSAGVDGLICGARSVVTDAKHVIVVAIFREPVARFLSALNFLHEMHAATVALDLPCRERDAAWYDRQRRHFVRKFPKDKLKYYLSYSPYATVFNATTRSDAADALEYLRLNSILGTTARLDQLFDVLTKAFKNDKLATSRYEGKQRIEAVAHGHAAPRPYCTRSTLSKDTVDALTVKVGLDADIYKAVVVLARRQSRLSERHLPRHARPSCVSGSSSMHHGSSSRRHHRPVVLDAPLVKLLRDDDDDDGHGNVQHRRGQNPKATALVEDASKASSSHALKTQKVPRVRWALDYSTAAHVFLGSSEEEEEVPPTKSRVPRDDDDDPSASWEVEEASARDAWGRQRRRARKRTLPVDQQTELALAGGTNSGGGAPKTGRHRRFPPPPSKTPPSASSSSSSSSSRDESADVATTPKQHHQLKQGQHRRFPPPGHRKTGARGATFVFPPSSNASKTQEEDLHDMLGLHRPRHIGRRPYYAAEAVDDAIRAGRVSRDQIAHLRNNRDGRRLFMLLANDGRDNVLDSAQAAAPGADAPPRTSSLHGG